MALEDLDQRFGSIAVKKGFITSEQLIEAISIQVAENIKDNKHRIIGTILRDMGLLTIEQINEVLKTIM
ncbi:MAG: hypothetical protein JRJ15_06980 [Deltaproteobacteria bacterium]|nr:hypothetical protein [Deltaproteobacteria bacterium]